MPVALYLLDEQNSLAVRVGAFIESNMREDVWLSEVGGIKVPTAPA
jgi:hypothetical protein